MSGTMEGVGVAISKVAKKERERTAMLTQRHIQSREVCLPFRVECGRGHRSQCGDRGSGRKS